jgi:hypothetical protein
MKIIALRGSDSCGKTETLNIAYTMLLPLVAISRGKRQLGGDKRDFEDELVLKNGRKVAFFTMGDYSIHTITAINKYDSLGFDILVCASNIKFVRPIRLIVTFNHVLITKSLATVKANEIIENTKDVTTIISHI